MKDTLEEGKMLLAMLTETWLREQLDAELSIDGYTLFRVDRSRQKKNRGRNSGGVAVYLKSTMAADIVFEFSSGVIEAICLKIEALNLILCAVYRQPDNPAGGHRSTAEQFGEFIKKLSDELSSQPSPTPNIVIGGDFNIPHASWPSGSATPGVSPDERNILDLVSDLSSQHFLTQISNEATHRGGNILDLLLTNCPDHFLSCEVTPTAPISSHHMVQFSTLLHTGTSVSYQEKSPTSAFDQVNIFSEDVNWPAIQASLEDVDWTGEFRNHSTTEILHVLTSKCEALALEHAPTKIKRKSKYSRIPRHRRILMRKRTRIRKSFHACSSPIRRSSILVKLTEIEKKLQESYQSQEQHDETMAVNNIKNNSKFFFTYARKKAKLSVPVGPLKDSTGNLVNSPMEIANILSNQYEGAFSKPAQIDLDFNHIPDNMIQDIEFTEQDIIDAIDEVPSNSAPGPDRFPAMFLKKCKHELAKPLHLLWRKSLDTGNIPDVFKFSNIIPIHKGGCRSTAKNYRPVALTSHLVKIFEKVIRSKLVSHIEGHGLMNPNQHGFRAGRSCVSQLLQHYDQITQWLEDGQNVDVIYLDFSKAFDKLDIMITLQKLYNLGIAGKLYDWIEQFLTNRRQCVLVSGAVSDQVHVSSGVPQGSVLGPLMFLILLGDIDANVAHSHVSSFADDTRVFTGIKNVEDSQQLQEDLNKIYDWAKRNNAEFNSTKFESLRYGNNEILKQSTSYTASNDETIEASAHVRDLGVQMSPEANFSQHISDISISASLKCAWILRVFKTRDRVALVTLWKSLVAPVLEYCCQLWNPSAAGLIQKLEAVQHSYLSKIAGVQSFDYWQQLSVLKMPSLQRRRERYVCIYVWKMLEGLVPNFGLQSSYSTRRGRSCIVPTVRRVASQRVQTIRHTSMGVLGPRLFNHLPQTVRDVSGCSVETFKNNLDKYLDTIPDEPRIPKLVKYCSKSSNSLIAY